MTQTAPVPRKLLWRGAIIVFGIAIAANAAALLGTNSASAGDGDGPFYTSIARNLAAGKGYVLGESFYPDTPTMGRAPVWPAILAIPAFLVPSASDFTLIRDTAACLNAVSAALLFGITWTLCGNFWISILAGIGYALYPVPLALAAGGFSEIPYVFVAALGIFLILLGGRAVYAGALILGLSALVRSNFVILPVMVGVAAVPWFRGKLDRKKIALAAVLFWLPSGLWIARNYLLIGQFPVLSTIEGETLYGANNDYVASTLSVWGYWVFPNEIPGETAKKELAKTMSEREVDLYYHRKGMAFIKQHWFEQPRLEVGKLIRGFVPVPWAPGWTPYLVFFFRGLLYAAILWNLKTLKGLNPVFRSIATGMFLVVFMTVLIYYGTYRFTFCFEVFFLPVVAIGLGTRLGLAGQRRSLRAI
jgi:hypothetical protein